MGPGRGRGEDVLRTCARRERVIGSSSADSIVRHFLAVGDSFATGTTVRRDVGPRQASAGIRLKYRHRPAPYSYE